MVGSVVIVLVAGNAQGLAYHVVLERDILCTTSADGLVGAPGCRAVVNDGVVGTRHTHCVARILSIDTQSALEAHVAAYNLRPDVDIRALDAYTLARCCLSCDGDIACGEDSAEVHIDDTRNIEDDVAWTVDADKTVLERSRYVVVGEAGDVIYYAATPSVGVASIPLSTREGQLTRFEGPYLSLYHIALGIHLIDAPVVGIHGV